jgi:hypothetical protein
MPTYKHINKENSPLNYTILDNNLKKRINLNYNKEIETLKYYNDPDNLLLINQEPYFNPLLNLNIITIANSDDIQAVQLSNDTFSVEIINSSDHIVYLFFQSHLNTPPFIIPPNSTRNISNFKNFVTQLVFKASDTILDNELFITQLKE